jgi:hypothetical protein
MCLTEDDVCPGVVVMEEEKENVCEERKMGTGRGERNGIKRDGEGGLSKKASCFRMGFFSTV